MYNVSSFPCVNTLKLCPVMRQPVAQLSEALCYKPEARGLDTRWGHWNFPLT